MESPLRPPPTGVTSNFHNPKFLGAPVVVAAGISVPLVLIASIARIYVRQHILQKWKFHDYVFCLSCLLGIAFIAFSIPLTLAKPYGYHVWDINVHELTKTSMLRLQVSAISLGPVLWFTKVALFCFLLHIFKSTRWFKNSCYVGIIVTGIVFSVYTCTSTLACAPQPDSDLKSYINGLKRDACSSPAGLNMIVTVTTSVVNALSDLYLIVAPLALYSTLNVTAKEIRGVYLMHLTGTIACGCGFLGVVYRIKSFVQADFTGYQIPLSIAIILEVALSLMIPCMPSFYTIWCHHTEIKINEKTTIGTPSTRLASSLSTHHTASPTPTPPSETKKMYRRTHFSADELPFRKASSAYGIVLNPRDSRMKALPCTPLPLEREKMAMKSPDSVRSMQLPIVLERSSC